jgi:hypothetical protein
MDIQTISSSVTDGTLQIMAICKNCTTWSLGSMDTTSTKQPFIFGLGPTGTTISSDSTSQNIDQHTVYNDFTLDMTQASFSGSNSPNMNSGNNAVSSGSTSSSAATTGAGAQNNIYTRTHGIFMAIAFVILFPLGVLVLRLGHSVIGHGIVQATAYCFVIVGLGTGIYLSPNLTEVSPRALSSCNIRPKSSSQLLTQRNQTDKRLQQFPPNHWLRCLLTPCCSSSRRPHSPPPLPPWPQDYHWKSSHGPRYLLDDLGYCQRTSRP